MCRLLARANIKAAGAERFRLYGVSTYSECSSSAYPPGLGHAPPAVYITNGTASLRRRMGCTGFSLPTVAAQGARFQ
jgi:hypothetical protein